MKTYYLNYSSTNGLTVNSFKLEGAFYYDKDIDPLLHYVSAGDDEDPLCCEVDSKTLELLTYRGEALHRWGTEEVREQIIALITSALDGGV